MSFELRGRIPTHKYGFVEVKQSISDDLSPEEVHSKIKFFQELITKNIVDVDDSELEVKLSNKFCPKCQNKLLEKLGISEKTGNPYHRIRCSECDFIDWVKVEPINKKNS